MVDEVTQLLHKPTSAKERPLPLPDSGFQFKGLLHFGNSGGKSVTLSVPCRYEKALETSPVFSNKQTLTKGLPIEHPNLLCLLKA